MLAITKVDMLDEELMLEMEQTVPKDIPYVFISAVTGYNVQKLKDMIWQILNS
jgi:GTP-binding protein